jgi:pSer/pThr/pTyr-binding forkhead associated (FHA) protein
MAAELRLIQDKEARQVFPLPQGVLTIGRDPTNHIQLDSPAVNARHARIFTVGDSSVIQDITGSAGIFVNDIEIVRQELCDEDIIHIGSHRFQFVNPAAPVRPAPRPPTAGVEPAREPAQMPAPPPPAAVPVTITQPVEATVGASDNPAPDAGAAPAATDIGASTVSDEPVAEPAPRAAPAQETRGPGDNVYRYPAPTLLRARENQAAPADSTNDSSSRDPSPLTVVADNHKPPQPDSAGLPDKPDAGAPGQIAAHAEAEADATTDTEPASIAADDDAGSEAVPTLDRWQPTETNFDAAASTESNRPLADDDNWSTFAPPAADWDTLEREDLAGVEPVDPDAPQVADGSGSTEYDTDQQIEPVDFPALTAGIEVISGPNAGKRLMFLKPRIVLGKSGGRSVIIERRDDEYDIRSADRGAAATLNGTLLLQDPVPLADGDQIEFAELSALFFQRSGSSGQL